MQSAINAAVLASLLSNVDVIRIAGFASGACVRGLDDGGC